MTFPTIHMNGTSAATLIDDYIRAMLKTQEALDAVSQIEFNARDYCPQGPDAWEMARNEMSERQAKLTSVLEDFKALTVHTLKHQ